MDKIKSIQKVKDKPQDGVVVALEKMLERAKRGEVYSIVILGESREGGIIRSHSIDVRQVLRLVGALEMFKIWLLDQFCESVDE